MFNKPDNALSQATASVRDAIDRLGQNFQWLSWPQTWANSGCGFGGVCMQAFWEAQTVIASGDTDAVLVYHAGRYAYTVEKPTDEFWRTCGDRKLPGFIEWQRGEICSRLDSSKEIA